MGQKNKEYLTSLLKWVAVALLNIVLSGATFLLVVDVFMKEQDGSSVISRVALEVAFMMAVMAPICMDLCVDWLDSALEEENPMKSEDRSQGGALVPRAGSGAICQAVRGEVIVRDDHRPEGRLDSIASVVEILNWPKRWRDRREMAGYLGELQVELARLQAVAIVRRREIEIEQELVEYHDALEIEREKRKNLRGAEAFNEQLEGYERLEAESRLSDPEWIQARREFIRRQVDRTLSEQDWG